MVLVTGATGLVGTHLLIHLVAQKERGNFPIRALYRTEAKRTLTKEVFFNHFTTTKKYNPSETAVLFDQIEWVQTHLEDIEGLKKAIENCTQVYHCAALISFVNKDYKRLRKTNIEGTANIVNLCIQYQLQKLCYVSSIATLGNAINDMPLDETAEWNPEALNSVYAITKYGAEIEVWRGSQEGLDVVIVNPGVILGPGSYTSGSGKLFSKIHKGLPFYTQGSTGFVGVNDVVTSMIQLMNSSIKNERYILVSENLNYKEVLSKIAKNLEKKAPKRQASSLMIQVYCMLNWLGDTLFGLQSDFSKATAISLQTKSVYDTSKIKTALAVNFEPLDSIIAQTAKDFLKKKHP